MKIDDGQNEGKCQFGKEVAGELERPRMWLFFYDGVELQIISLPVHLFHSIVSPVWRNDS
jgi:hypothetical protein